MSKHRRAGFIALICIAVICLLLALVIAVMYYREDSASEDVLEEYRAEADASEDVTPPATTAVPEATTPPVESTDVSLATAAPEATSTPQPTEEPTPAPVPNPYEESFLANPDMAGWLLVPGTNIDYPIMWTPEDENYYLYRAFDKSDNVNGSLILDTDSCLEPLTTNLIIHGHNMKSGAMFGNLTDYESKEYYEEHKQIILYTEECQRNYEIVAVFRSQVYKKSDDVFKFYKFFQADTQEEFDDFYNNIKSLSAYDTGVTAEFGDRFITLSTCVYHVKNGRFVVVAKEVEPGDTYLPIER